MPLDQIKNMFQEYQTMNVNDEMFQGQTQCIVYECFNYRNEHEITPQEYDTILQMLEFISNFNININ